ncbi:MAG TPA: phosphate ABC transporter permease subunit PstC [Candidatus Acidoferrales bacterium]|nr:phosphate ABC transporter permease subunit PstC [Candidatus Acidoferrales bacterium]
MSVSPRTFSPSEISPSSFERLRMRVFSFRTLTGTFGCIVAGTLIAIVIFLIDYAWPAVRLNGWGFLTRNNWNLGSLYADPILRNGQQILPGAEYGILFLVVGTILSTVIALAIALPVGVGAALFLAEAISPSMRSWLSFFVELLAAIPSVVYGLWGYVVVIPFLGHHVFPLMAKSFGFIPFLSGPTGSGYGLLTSGCVLSLMIVPLITATLRDALVAQSPTLREGSVALGASRFEALWTVMLPAARRVLIGSSILATGRALGETMAVLMISGNALNYLPSNIYTPISTMAAFIVSQLDSALQDPTGMAIRSLSEIALVLCLISIVVNSLARLLLYYEGRQSVGAT